MLLCANTEGRSEKAERTPQRRPWPLTGASSRPSRAELAVTFRVLGIDLRGVLDEQRCWDSNTCRARVGRRGRVRQGRFGESGHLGPLFAVAPQHRHGVAGTDGAGGSTVQLGQRFLERQRGRQRCRQLEEPAQVAFLPEPPKGARWRESEVEARPRSPRPAMTDPSSRSPGPLGKTALSPAKTIATVRNPLPVATASMRRRVMPCSCLDSPIKRAVAYVASAAK